MHVVLRRDQACGCPGLPWQDGCAPGSSLADQGLASGRWQARSGHHTGPHTHTSQGDAVEPPLQAVAMVGAPLTVAWTPVEDGLVVVEQLRVAQGVHVGARLQADAVWTQATGMVQILGEPVQVSVQPVGMQLVSPWRERPEQGGPGGMGMLEEGHGGLTSHRSSGHPHAV